jgi:hypothetical protein
MGGPDSTSRNNCGVSVARAMNIAGRHLSESVDVASATDQPASRDERLRRFAEGDGSSAGACGAGFVETIAIIGPRLRPIGPSTV